MKRRMNWLAAIVILFPALALAQGLDEPPEPGGKAAEEKKEKKEKKAPVKTVKLSSRKDRVILTDGKVLEGAIVAAGSKAVVIVTAAGELTVPRSKVDRIERGRPKAQTLQPRTYETEVVEGKHEQIVVPPGMDEEGGGGPPGLIPRIGPNVPGRAITLRHNPKKGDLILANIHVGRKDVEKLGDEAETTRHETVKLALEQEVTRVNKADGAWTVKATYELRGLMRGYVNVTALEAKSFAAVRVMRSLSASGRWDPGADRVTGAVPGDDRFTQWLGYLTVPVPEQPALFGSTVKLEEAIPPAIARTMLRPPAHVTLGNWAVTGKYTVKGTMKVAGTNCAVIAIDLEGKGAGNGLYNRDPARLDVKADSHWEVYFAVGAGRPVHCSITESATTTGEIGKKAVECATTVTVSAVAAATGAPPPAKVETPKAPVQPPTPLVPPVDNKKFDKALDNLMDKLKDPKFLQGKKED